MAEHSASQTVSLGCGTLILIALIVLFFGGGVNQDVKQDIRSLRQSVEEVRTALDAQAVEIKALRQAVEGLQPKPRPAAEAEPAGPGK